MGLEGYRTIIIAVAGFLLAFVGKIDPSAGLLFLDFLKNIGITFDAGTATMFFTVVMIILRWITAGPVGFKLPKPPG